ncbi:hypothetical protein HanXRQr2_Chr15g0708401 [Helianthus annuus]|uniref:Uncharacterized protein n=1 Tax=Helianthus annuus TaxID=4232 RepID=A0A9K3E4C8_HELAN|nr:hypothetical protein HanXRQr2_Chr15g0708401 [Helianthus annuus]KAJ0832549.1 hypothetical protein HanPSC8_Chr15g0680001 [Helianthus annuus]
MTWRIRGTISLSFLPPQATHLSVTDFIFSLLNTTKTTAGSLIDATTRHRIPYTDVKFFVRNLAAVLRLLRKDTTVILYS